MSSAEGFDIGLGLEGSHAMVTGGGGQIGQVIVRAFLSAGANVTALDINEAGMRIEHERLLWVQADTTDEEELRAAFSSATSKFGMVTICCAAAGLDLSFIPSHSSICDMPLSQWQTTIAVNTTGTFLTARNWLRGIRDRADDHSRNISLIIIGSEAGTFGVPGNADYATSKSAIQYGLVKSMAPEAASIHRHARVNALAPGPVDTPQFRKECEQDPASRYLEFTATVAQAQSVPMEQVARSCLMLASDHYSASITGQLIPIDSGKCGRIFWKSNGQRTW